MITVAFVTDASARVGGGHLARCLALAEAFGALGWSCRIAAPARAFGVLAVPATVERSVLADGPLAPGDAVLGCKVVVIDRYDATEAHEHALGRASARVATIADGPVRRYAADVVIDGTPGRVRSAYDGAVGAGTTVLAGPDYAPLRAAFARTRASAHARRRVPGPVARIAVALGAGDVGDARAAVVGTARRICPDAAIDVIAGRDAEAVAEAYAAADLAIGAAGVSALERCALGLPSLACALADNQKDQLAALADAGALRSLGPWDDLAPKRLADALRVLAGDADVRRAMAERAFALIDGAGARRVAQALAAP